jgi:hypothetical protein
MLAVKLAKATAQTILRSLKQSLREMRAVQTKKDTDDGVIASIQWA